MRAARSSSRPGGVSTTPPPLNTHSRIVLIFLLFFFPDNYSARVNKVSVQCHTRPVKAIANVSSSSTRI